MSCSGSDSCTCGCCAGISAQTPQPITNLPGQPAISYRTGTWAIFKDSMLARLSSADYPALAALKTRDDDDFTIAFLDATSVVLDILTFYQERLANESYLRTAVQLQSLTELSRLIAYQPAPGIAASVYLAFTLKSAPGLPPDPSTPPITIPAGTQVQSIPGQGQTPQTFETSAPVPAKADWNALPVQTGQPWVPENGDSGMYLEGVAAQLQPGDLILLIGDERATVSPSSPLWSVNLLTSVTADTTNNRTWIKWAGQLATATLPVQHPKVYAFRQRASLFGYNAIDPHLLDTKHTTVSTLLNSAGTEWANLNPTATIDLDSAYSKITTNSWLALLQPDSSVTTSPSGDISLYNASSIAPVSRSAFGLSAKITRVAPDTTTNLAKFNPRNTMVFAQSDQLAPNEEPFDHPLYGTQLDLEVLRPDLVGATVVAVTGVAQKISLNPGITNLEFVPDDPTASAVTLNPGDTFTLIEPPPPPFNPDGSIPSWATSNVALTLKVSDASQRTGTLQGKTITVTVRRAFFHFKGFPFEPGGGVTEITEVVPLYLSYFSLVAASSSDPEISEYALVSQVVGITSTNSTVPHTQIQLQYPLINCYNRVVTTVNANVALATAGTTVTEIMGNGGAASPNQNFALRQSPLTYVQATTPNGRQSTLLVRASGVAWTEVPTLYQQPASAQVFAIENQSDSTSDVFFGDGTEGATLPTGQNNIIATYRIGSGSAGNVAAGAITTLMQRPLGVSGVTNPEAATGGADPQSIDYVRINAPQTVLTLGRAVSITDYQNFAATFAGIAQAYAIWIPSSTARGVFLTVAATGGVALQPGDNTLVKLVAALQGYGNPQIPIVVQSYIETLFGFTADVMYNTAYDQPTVKANIMQTLSTAYSFAQRSFGQGVSADEIATTIQNVAGVVAVNVTGLTPGPSSKGGDLMSLSGGFTVSNWNSWMSQQVTVPRPYSDTTSRICPYLPVASAQGLPFPAEILVLDPAPTSVTLGVMQ
jgi:Baseplate J-like protein